MKFSVHFLSDGNLCESSSFLHSTKSKRVIQSNQLFSIVLVISKWILEFIMNIYGHFYILLYTYFIYQCGTRYHKDTN